MERDVCREREREREREMKSVQSNGRQAYKVRQAKPEVKRVERPEVRLGCGFGRQSGSHLCERAKMAESGREDEPKYEGES
jgi:hypothetical protein